MTITVIVEAFGFYYHRVLNKANHQFYNVSVPLIIILFLLLLLNHSTRKNHRHSVALSIIAFTGFAFINAGFIQGMSRFCSYTYIAGTFLLVIAIAFYFLETIQRPIHISLEKEPMFWVCTGILILYLPKSILYTVFEYFAYDNHVMKTFGTTFHLMNKVLSVIFFSFLSYASICRLIYRK